MQFLTLYQIGYQIDADYDCYFNFAFRCHQNDTLMSTWSDNDNDLLELFYRMTADKDMPEIVVEAEPSVPRCGWHLWQSV